MGDFRRTLQANQGAEMAAQGRTIYIKDATAPIQVVFDGSERFLMSQGDKLTRAQTFKGFRIENPRDELLDATITVTDGDYAQRAISGEVTIDDRQPLNVQIDGVNPIASRLPVYMAGLSVQVRDAILYYVIQGIGQTTDATATASADAIAERSLRIGEFADSEAERIGQAVAAAFDAAGYQNTRRVPEGQENVFLATRVDGSEWCAITNSSPRTLVVQYIKIGRGRVVEFSRINDGAQFSTNEVSSDQLIARDTSSTVPGFLVSRNNLTGVPATRIFQVDPGNPLSQKTGLFKIRPGESYMTSEQGGCALQLTGWLE